MHRTTCNWKLEWVNRSCCCVNFDDTEAFSMGFHTMLDQPKTNLVNIIMICKIHSALSQQIRSNDLMKRRMQTYPLCSAWKNVDIDILYFEWKHSQNWGRFNTKVSFKVNEIGPISYCDNERQIFSCIVFGTRICCIFNIQNKVSFHLIQKYICWQWRGLQWVTGPRSFSFLLICQTVIEPS